MPLDPAYPRERLAFMLKDAGAPVLLTHSALAARLPAAHAHTVRIDADAAVIAAQPTSAPAVALDPHHPAYVIYTSGSTGTPKGVVVTHQNVVRLVMNANFVELTADDVVLHLAPLAFDASTYEIWGALLNGAKLVIYPDVHLDVSRLAGIVAQANVSVLWLTAALFHQVVGANLAAIAGVKDTSGRRRRFVCLTCAPGSRSAQWRSIHQRLWSHRGDDVQCLLRRDGLACLRR